MAGHSKWNNIKNRKGAQDKIKGKAFSEAGKMIKIAVKEGSSGDPKSNPALRLALDKARAVNMPKSNIQRAIDRGLGKTKSGLSLRDVVYEGFVAGGVGIIVAAITENPNRTSAEIRMLFSKSGGSLGSTGSVSYMFARERGEYKVTMPMDINDEKKQVNLQEIMDAFRSLDDVEDVYCAGVWEGKE
jgi:YebC/PmpR family DNA-binding regulatory protein